MTFDPTKPYGTVHGKSTTHSGAKFEQAGFVYDIHHKCLNSDKVSAAEKSLKEQATDRLIHKAEAGLQRATAAMERAAKANDAKHTNVSRTVLERTTSVYRKALAEIEKLKA